MNRNKVSAVILSAGFSSRMKTFKPLLPCKGRPMVECAITLFQQKGIKDIVVVTGHQRHRVEPVIKKTGARAVFNPDFKTGMLSSVKQGVHHIQKNANGFFLLPVDIPSVRGNTIETLLNQFEKHTDSIIMPFFKGRSGHPPIIPCHLKDRILSLNSRQTLRDILFNQACKRIDVSGYDRGIHLDADDPEGYKAVCSKMAFENIPDKEECMAIIDDHLPDDDRIRAHLADVSMTAVRLAGEVNTALDYNLIIAASLLHDIKRKEKKHAEKGARLLETYGFQKVADIIAQHMDIELETSKSVSEKEIVYFADKLCNGKGLDLNYHSRFADSMKKSPWAVSSILKRYGNTQKIHARVEASAGKPLYSIFTP